MVKQPERLEMNKLKEQPSNTEAEKALVRRHRVGVAGMLGAFSIAIFLIDNAAL